MFYSIDPNNYIYFVIFTANENCIIRLKCLVLLELVQMYTDTLKFYFFNNLYQHYSLLAINLS